MSGTELFLLVFVIGISVIFTIALSYLLYKAKKIDGITTELINDICNDQNKMNRSIDNLCKDIYKPMYTDDETPRDKPLWEIVDRLLDDVSRMNNKLSNLNYSEKELEQAKKDIAKLAKTLDDFQIEVSSCIGTLEKKFNDAIQQKLLYQNVEGNVLLVN